uniref:Uncharacterized protein n=1 Tax=Cacopsylla melanoneura TaxID=428564 RepID=A0A8D8ZBI9_9HEMI
MLYVCRKNKMDYTMMERDWRQTYVSQCYADGKINNWIVLKGSQETRDVPGNENLSCFSFLVFFFFFVVLQTEFFFVPSVFLMKTSFLIVLAVCALFNSDC